MPRYGFRFHDKNRDPAPSAFDSPSEFVAYKGLKERRAAEFRSAVSGIRWYGAPHYCHMMTSYVGDMPHDRIRILKRYGIKFDGVRVYDEFRGTPPALGTCYAGRRQSATIRVGTRNSGLYIIEAWANNVAAARILYDKVREDPSQFTWHQR